MAEEAIIRIIPESGAAGGGVLGGGAARAGAGPRGAAGLGGLVKGIGAAFTAALSILGIGSIVAIIVAIVSNFKTLIRIISTIVKLISFFLKPIADVILVLLLPILFILKPLVILVNQVMAPFVKLAIQVMRQGAKALAAGDVAGANVSFAAATGIVLAGLSSVIVALSGEVLKLFISSIASFVSLIGGELIALFIKNIFNLFGATDETIEQATIISQEKFKTAIASGVESVNTFVDTVSAVQISVIARVAAEMAEAVGVETDTFKTKMLETISTTFLGEDGVNPAVAKVLGIDLKDSATTAIDETGTSIVTAWSTNMQTFQDRAVESFGSLVDSLNAEVDRLKSDVPKKRGFLGKAFDFTAEVLTFGKATTPTFG